jgi:hypothetical protein
MANDHDNDHCWSSLPHYRPGTGLTAEQLNASQRDAQTRTRILNLGMNGVGIAHGFKIKTDEKGHIVIKDGCIYIGCGLGFDRYGRMLYWQGGSLRIGDILGKMPDCPGSYCLAVHYAERAERGRKFDPCYEGTDWISACVGFTLTRGCEDQPCPDEIDPDDCTERWRYICERNGFVPKGAVCKDDDLEKACETPPDLEVNECGTVGYDPHEKLPLACLEICEAKVPDCDGPYDFCPDKPVKSCRKRKVAYRNQLLYELISRRDVPLSKVKSYSWSDSEVHIWSDNNRMPFSEFARRVKECHRSYNGDPENGFSIMFTRPLLRSSLHPMSVVMDIYIPQERPFYWMPHRVPAAIKHLDRDGKPLGSSDLRAWGVLICPDPKWIKQEIDDEDSSIKDCNNKEYLGRVEIMLHGHLIRDMCGRMPDARPGWVDQPDRVGLVVGHPGDPCGHRAGQDRVGDTWRSVLRIARDGVGDEDEPNSYTTSRAQGD